MMTYIDKSALENALNLNIENEIVEQLLTLEKVLRAHNAVMKSEMNFQQELMARIWTLSQRYTLLNSSGSCFVYLEKYKLSVDAVLQEFMCKFKQIRSSNCRINVSLIELRKSWMAFCSLCAKLDMSIESPLVTGNALHKPISYFLELFSDIFKYFHAWLLKLKFMSHQMDPLKICSIENYRKQIEISEDFEEYLTVGLTYCNGYTTAACNDFSEVYMCGYELEGALLVYKDKSNKLMCVPIERE